VLASSAHSAKVHMIGQAFFPWHYRHARRQRSNLWCIGGKTILDGNYKNYLYTFPCVCPSRCALIYTPLKKNQASTRLKGSQLFNKKEEKGGGGIGKDQGKKHAFPPLSRPSQVPTIYTRRPSCIIPPSSCPPALPPLRHAAMPPFASSQMLEILTQLGPICDPSQYRSTQMVIRISRTVWPDQTN